MIICDKIGSQPINFLLNPGDVVRYSFGGPTEEGWYRKDVVYECSEDDKVRATITVDGSDCDGRLTRVDEYVATGETMHNDEDGRRYYMTTWQSTGGSQRDYTAESMGY